MLCLSIGLVQVAQFMLYFSTWLISRMDLIKYIFEKPTLTRKKTIKGQAIADYLVDQPLNDPKFSKSLFLNEDVLAIEPKTSNMEPWRWKIYFDGVASTTGNGVGAVLVSLKGQQIPVSVKLNFDCTNVTEYEACIVGFQVALEFDTYVLSIFGDSLLIISQIKGKWQAQDTKFRNITFAYLPRAHNQFINALANLASMVKLAEGDDMRQLRIEVSGVLAYMWTSRNAWMSKSR